MSDGSIRSPSRRRHERAEHGEADRGDQGADEHRQRRRHADVARVDGVLDGDRADRVGDPDRQAEDHHRHRAGLPSRTPPWPMQAMPDRRRDRRRRTRRRRSGGSARCVWISRPSTEAETRTPTTIGASSRPDCVGETPVTALQEQRQERIGRVHEDADASRPRSSIDRTIGMANRCERDDRLPAALRSHARNPTSTTSPPPMSPSVVGDDQPNSRRATRPRRAGTPRRPR